MAGQFSNSAGVSQSFNQGTSTQKSQSLGANQAQSSQQASSTSFIPDYPERQLLMQFAQTAANMAPQMQQWADGVYNKNQSLADSIVNEGKLYASPEKIAADMGMAESTSQQASEAGRQNAISDLTSYGIDPSSGRYAGLDRADRVNAAAAAAGAGNQQRLATEATGRALRSEGANLSLANANSGVNLMNLPNEYLQTASQLKNPLLGQESQSSAQSTSSGYNTGSSSGSSQNSGDAASANGANSFPASNPFGGDKQQGGGSGGGSGGGGPSDTTGAVTPQGAPAPQQHDNPFAGDGGGGGGDNPNPYGDGIPSGDITWPTSFGGGGEGDQGPTQSSPGAEVDPGGVDWNSGDSGSGDSAPMMAAGGPVPEDMSPSGGNDVDDVPAQINQTGERANLNADEFVIPRDVALWKGQEFFQNLIMKSRQARMGAPARPTMGQGQ